MSDVTMNPRTLQSEDRQAQQRIDAAAKAAADAKAAAARLRAGGRS